MSMLAQQANSLVQLNKGLETVILGRWNQGRSDHLDEYLPELLRVHPNLTHLSCWEGIISAEAVKGIAEALEVSYSRTVLCHSSSDFPLAETEDAACFEVHLCCSNRNLL